MRSEETLLKRSKETPYLPRSAETPYNQLVPIDGIAPKFSRLQNLSLCIFWFSVFITQFTAPINSSLFIEGLEKKLRLEFFRNKQNFLILPNLNQTSAKFLYPLWFQKKLA